MSMHRASFVVAVKTIDGKILREDTLTDSKIPTVYLPFGSEYSILLKNLHTRRAVVSVDIDGSEVSPGQKLVIEPKGELDLERFVRSNSEGRRFKFVERTNPAVGDPDFGGNGGIKVTWQFEKEIKPTVTQTVIHQHNYNYDYWYPQPYRWVPYWRYHPDFTPIYTCFSQTMGDGETKSWGTVGNNSSGFVGAPQSSQGEGPRSIHVNAMMMAQQQPTQDQVGATVEGSVSNQKFGSTYVGELETETHEIVFRILAPKPKEGKVAEAVTVEATRRLYCPKCGTKVEFTDRFCRSCGSSQQA